MEIGKLLAIALVALFVVGVATGGDFSKVQDWFKIPSEKPSAPTETEKTVAEKPPAPEVSGCPTRGTTIGTSSGPLALYVMDALDPTSGLANVTIEVLPTSEIAWNPDREIKDSGTTDANGRVEFTSGVLKSDYTYKIVARGDNTVYDFEQEMTTPCVPTGVTNYAYTFDEKLKLYRVGEFKTIGTDVTENITGKTGFQQTTISIYVQLNDSEIGKASFDPVLTLRSPEGYTLEPGKIRSISLTPASAGTTIDLVGPAGDSVVGREINSYLVGETPITVKTGKQIMYMDALHYIMTSADVGQYNVKIVWDADEIEPSSDKLEICLDDLGGYRATSPTTKTTKASATCVTLQWTN